MWILCTDRGRHTRRVITKFDVRDDAVLEHRARLIQDHRMPSGMVEIDGEAVFATGRFLGRAETHLDESGPAPVYRFGCPSCDINVVIRKDRLDAGLTALAAHGMDTVELDVLGR